MSWTGSQSYVPEVKQKVWPNMATGKLRFFWHKNILLMIFPKNKWIINTIKLFLRSTVRKQIIFNINFAIPFSIIWIEFHKILWVWHNSNFFILEIVEVKLFHIENEMIIWIGFIGPIDWLVFAKIKSKGVSSIDCCVISCAS